MTHVVALPLGFERVTACLQGDPLPVATFEVPLEFTQPEVAVEPAVATMCASHVIQDEASWGHLYGDSHYLLGEWPLGISTQ